MELDFHTSQRMLTGGSAGQLAMPIGASYAFDGGGDGIAGIYATRILERGIDPRALCAEVRAEREGAPDRGAARRALMSRSRVASFGRGTAAHLAATAGDPPALRPVPRRARPAPAPSRFDRLRPGQQAEVRWSRRLAAAGLLALLLLPLGVLAAHAQEASPQARYVVQEGDTLAGVAAEFGVDPQAIAAASEIQNPPDLTPREVIVIPAAGESPEAAAESASYYQGSSPFVVGAHEVAPGETLGDIAAAAGLDAWTLAAFNGIDDVDALDVGQRLRIPLTDSVSTPGADGANDAGTTASGGWWTPESAPAADEIDATTMGWQKPDAAPVFAAEVPAYAQAYSLSCEYAAAYIATAAFGNGVPESAFMSAIGPSQNPHWGYRGEITGAWGGTDDYGVYPEALAPTLNAYGFTADVFYGADPAALTARLDDGMPVLTWLGYFGDNAWQQQDEGSYLLAPGMHVVTVYGYDDGGVYLSNPGRGTYDYYGWDEFLSKWRVLDGMALAVAPMA